VNSRLRYSFVAIIVFLTIVLSLIMPIRVFADDSTPSAPATPVVAVQPSSTGIDPVSTPAPATPAAGGPTTSANYAATQAAAAAATASVAPTGLPTTVATAADSSASVTAAVPVASATPASQVASDPTVGASVAAISNTGSVLTDPSGNPIPLASAQAANILSQPLPDPIVCPAGSTSSSSPGCVPGYVTISSAITAAPPGSVIFVKSGTYVEQVTVNKSLTLIGEGAATTIIQAPGVLALDADGTKSILVFTGLTTSSEFSGFTVQGPGSGGCDSIDNGIYVRGGAAANIHDNIVRNIRDNPLGGCQNGVAIRVGRQKYSQTGSAVIKNNQILQYQKGGIVVDNTGSNATITGNIINGIGPTPLIASNGIQISRGANGTITGNTVTGNFWTGTYGGTNNPISDPVADGATGILLYLPGTSIIDIGNNTLTGNQFGIGTVGATDVNIHDNNITGAPHTGHGYPTGILISNDPTGGTTGNITNNQITLNDYGILIFDTSGDPASNVGVHNNSITSNSLYGAWTNSKTPINAQNNWWGNASGPNDNSAVPDACGLTLDNPAGTGGHVSACINYAPWLLAAPVINPPGGGAHQPPTAPPPGIIPVTGGQQIVLSCDTAFVTLLVGDIQVTFTGLCGYGVVLDPIISSGLPGILGSQEKFVAGVNITVTKDGKSVETLPVGSGIRVSYPKPVQANPAVLYWDHNLWVEKPSFEQSLRIVSDVNLPGANVLVTK
jgi:nitrous oxidase accessory protein NosD